MKVSIVTISYNQADYIEKCLKSVINQTYNNIEYIVIDGGSTDGSAEIINRYAGDITKILIEKDDGAAHGLNKGFNLASGELYAFLNSDDEITETAIEDLVQEANRYPNFDVYSGHGFLVDADGRFLRRLFSDHFNLKRGANGAAYIIQPSTIFRRDAYDAIEGFNIQNRSTWDGELWVDMAKNGARFRRVEGYYSLYRLHGESITASAAARSGLQRHHDAMFAKVFGRQPNIVDRLIAIFLKIERHFRNPRGFFERLFYGPVSGRQ